MNKAQAKSFERMSALAANFYSIEKMCRESDVLMSFDEMHRAAVWNYNSFGYGYVSIDKYLEYRKNKYSKRLYNTDVKLWYKLLKIIFNRDNYTCSYCGKVGGKLEGDHIIPISKGGTNELHNLTTSCRKCNRQKKDKTVIEFKIWREIKNV